MRFFVSAKPNAKRSSVAKVDETHFRVVVKEPPVKGAANRAIIKLLAEYFNVSSFRIKIVSGYTSRNKVIEIN